MSPELDATLRADYPLTFAVEPIVDPDDLDIPAVQSAFAHWGFECGDGWCDLIGAPCLNLQDATKNGAPQAIARQVKEKLGRLRFYTNGQNAEQMA
ncbi:hypothetical protein VSR82_13815 [Burkholderia sp. JPY481]